MRDAQATNPVEVRSPRSTSRAAFVLLLGAFVCFTAAFYLEHRSLCVGDLKSGLGNIELAWQLEDQAALFTLGGLLFLLPAYGLLLRSGGMKIWEAIFYSAAATFCSAFVVWVALMSATSALLSFCD
jgi:hypothetical protein